MSGRNEGGSRVSKKCYKDSLKLKNGRDKEPILSVNTHKVHYADIEPYGDPLEDSLIPVEKLKTFLDRHRRIPNYPDRDNVYIRIKS